ncbi:MAG: prolyl oligopeptidase family serine peptidase [Clostridia bacterium]|nr:prolyl oligopeptidase family serine peptidase [Clostridia bacterium]
MNKISEGRTGKLKYLRYGPTDFSENKKYPIIVHFHGSGSRGDNVEILKDQAIVRFAKNAENFPFVMFLPQCSEDCWFDVFEQLKEFVCAVANLHYADKAKVYLSGVSMGGYAAWQMLMSEPTVFRKAVICCGGGMYWNASRIKIPVRAFHGKDDLTVFCEESRKMVNAVNSNGGNAKLTEYDGTGHNCWDKTYNDPEIYRWLLAE